ncbi:MAG: META domain-containing protein [Candidatus Krumholzibacteriia bacterium]
MIRSAWVLCLALAIVSGCGPRPAATAAQADAPVELRGMFTYLADAASFLDCVTRERHPVAMEGDYLALERAYGEVRRYPAEPILVVVSGHYATRPGMEGDIPVTHLIVDRYVACYPGETCGNSDADERLEDQYWKLTRLVGEPVERPDGQREPHLVLHSNEHRLAGSGGCNRLTGSYDLRDEELTFSGVATTMMACPDAMEQEQRFLAVLRDVRFWRIHGAHLELLGPAREILARLEATPLQ